MKDRMDAAVQLALRTAPYLRDVIATARFVITDKITTAGCDKYWRVYFSPKALETWTPQEAAWVILHECGGHLLRRHHAASGDHPDETPYRLNVAQDLEIESWEWPDGPARRPSGDVKGLHPSDYDLPVGLTWQEYLKLLPEDAQTDTDCGSGSHGEERPWELGSEDAPVKPGSALESAVIKAGAEAISAAKERDDVPAGLAVWADEELKPPPIDWRFILRSALTKRVSAGMVDMIGPPRERHGLLQPRWRAPRPRIAIVADTSGSMDGEGGTVLGACVKLCHTFGAVDICWCDTEPVWQSARDAADLRPVGGGGTDIRPGILQAREKNYDVIVIITDCDTPWPAACDRSIVLAVEGGNPPENWRKINVN